ncbi:hypothetical protein GIB67_011395 [Kingdonia uniflora]|uniref:RING-type domain-containing protein n=1 Tax=Kingdonia uniflora TaxID=39325 RepID=A0A7J7PAJ7_9MAGN|nr:hypothetical protein GIB67_026565 [Kingdonia uniflora]KAF6176461.1 hypothetical protein GIB67_011395 [Kingdonia uniflora]
MVTPDHHLRRLLNTEAVMGAPSSSRSRSYNKEGNFDSNMVIILAALLCALIFTLGLNSIVRCALRCGRRATHDVPGRRDTSETGLKKRELRQIPVAVYGSGSSIRATDCPICLGEFVKGEKIRVLPKCKHGFHVNCIDTWFVAHSSCPNCRNSLLERPMIFDGADLEAGVRPNRSDEQGEVVIMDDVS